MHILAKPMTQEMLLDTMREALESLASESS
jgi:hypothetical protein